VKPYTPTCRGGRTWCGKGSRSSDRGGWCGRTRGRGWASSSTRRRSRNIRSSKRSRNTSFTRTAAWVIGRRCAVAVVLALFSGERQAARLVMEEPHLGRRERAVEQREFIQQADEV